MSRLCLAVWLFSSVAVAAEDLTVLPTKDDAGSPRQMLSRYLRGLAQQAFDARSDRLDKLKTLEQLAEYQQQMRKTFLAELGGFPPRTPLRATATSVNADTAKDDGYRLERIVFESQPGHHVTAALYLPISKPPYPAVLVPCGHTRTGKGAIQRVPILLAKFGIAAMCYDPIGQGERYQFLDAKGQPRYRSTTEHTILGVGSMPVGRNTATYRIWDGMRALDYLAARDDVDGERLGVTGCSGGGTLTSYLMALDDRVACAAPSCFITSLPRLLDTIGPQDAEQNIHGQIARGLGHGDYLMLRAPKPTLMLVATRDFFDIRGAWDSFREAKQFYTKLGFSERVNLTETDTKHGYPRAQRESMLRWMRRWLVGVDEDVREPEFSTRPQSELICTPEGQVMQLDGERSVVELNIERAEQLAIGRKRLWQPDHRDEVLHQVRRLAGVRSLARLPQALVEHQASLARDDYRIEKLVISPDPAIALPALAFVPNGETKGRVLYVHEAGKAADAEVGGAIEKLVARGQYVLAVDLRGLGETGPAKPGMWGGAWNDLFVSYLLGKPLVGMRTEDILVSAHFLRDLKPQRPIELVGIGAAGVPALHAAALEPELFGGVRLSGTLRSWLDVVRHPNEPGQFGSVVNGALAVYDLPDLVGSLPEGMAKIEERFVPDGK